MEVVDYKNMRLTAAQRKALALVMGSWRSVHVQMRVLDESIKSLNTLATMLAYELQSTAPRHQLITRIHMRINAIRQRMEYAMAIKHATVMPETRPPKPPMRKYKPGKKAKVKKVTPKLARASDLFNPALQ